DEEGAGDGSIEMYARIPELHATQIRELYEAIADGATPILIHCSAGKDRTGIAVALLLDLLRVERSLVLDDYAMSERLLDWAKLDIEATLGVGAGATQRRALPPVVRDLLLRSDPRYLQSAFTHLERRFGSTEGFLSAIGVTSSVMSDLRHRLLDD